MGSDKAQAIAEANDLNAIIHAQIREARLAAIVAQDSDKPTFCAWCKKYVELLARRNLKQNTLRTRLNIVEQWRRRFAGHAIGELGTRDIADVIEDYVAAGKARMAQAMRSGAIDLWGAAVEQGWAKTNVAAVTRMPSAPVKRGRLVLDQLRQILDASRQLDPWVANSILLGVTTAQRRQDVALMRFRRGSDWEGLFTAHVAGEPGVHPYPHVHDGSLWVVQQKARGQRVGSLVRIPLSLRLEALELSVGDVVAACRDSVASPYLLHHTRRRTMSSPGDAVHINKLSKGFARARDLAALTWPQAPATYYELRSLAERLYQAQGVDTQALLGHKQAKTTALYHDARGAEWIEVKG